MSLDAGQIRAALAELLDPRDPDAAVVTMGAGSDDLSSGRDFLATLAPGGWGVPSWPRGLGGRGASVDEARLIEEVLAEFERPDLYPYAVALHLIGPALLKYGTPDQQQRWMPPIANGSEIWCQMFSEPDAGSDMANCATRAVPDGDEWVLDGQKVWTSRGPYSAWGMCLARHDPDLPKHPGLTMFAVAMTAPGVEVRPLIQMNGDRHFCEIFLSGVRVPDTDRIGDAGAGWAVARDVLAFERAAMSGGSGGLAADEAPTWLFDLAARGVLDHLVWRDRAMRAYILDQVARLTAARSAAAGGLLSGGSGGKLRNLTAFKARAYLFKDSFGPAGMLTEHDRHIEFLTAPSMSIRGGTDEVQRNGIGEGALGLPREPQLDRGVPWSEARKGLL